MPVIDTHCHVDTSSMTACTAMLDELERSMDNAGITAAIVMPLAMKGFDPLIEFNTFLKCISQRSRMKPMLCYDKNSGNDCRKMLRELLQEDGVAGVKFFTGYDAYGPLDAEIVEILNLLEKYGKVAKFHTGATARTERSVLRFCCNPCDFDELAVLRPNLKIDCAHFMAPNHIAMAPVLDKNHTVHSDLSGLIDRFDKKKDCQYAGFVRYRLADALAYLPDTKQLMFGSDFPFCEQEEMISFINSFFDEYEFSDEHRNLIWYESAIEFYGFSGIRKQ